MKNLKLILITLLITIVFCPKNIFAKTLVAKNINGATLNINVEDTDTILNVSNKIKEAFGIVNEKVIPTYNGNLLDENKLVIDYLLEENAVIDFTTRWTYTIKFHANGGSGQMSDLNGVDSGLESFLLPENTFMAPGDKRFKGWSLKSDGEIIKSVTPNDVKNGVVTVYAIWEYIPLNYKYIFITGNGQSLEEKHIEEFTFTIEGDYRLFDKLLINDVEFEKDVDYKLIQNRTIIVFLKPGLDKLNTYAPGRYDIEVRYTNDKVVKGKFKIEEEIQVDPLVEINKTEEVKISNPEASHTPSRVTGGISKFECVAFLTSIMAFFIFVIKK